MGRSGGVVGSFILTTCAGACELVQSCFFAEFSASRMYQHAAQASGSSAIKAADRRTASLRVALVLERTHALRGANSERIALDPSQGIWQHPQRKMFRMWFVSEENPS